MGAAESFRLMPEEVILRAYRASGQAVDHEEYSLRAIGRPDIRFQARVDHLDMDHVHRLDMVLRNRGGLAPIIVFYAVRFGEERHIVADGFHRYEVYFRANRETIPAIIITVEWDRIEHEARLYAASCNQTTSLGRTPQDVRKAVEMLCAEPECDAWTNTRFAEHCGSTPDTVKKIRMEYAIRHGRDLPRGLVEKRRKFAGGAGTRPIRRPGFVPDEGAPNLPATAFPGIPKAATTPGPEHEPDVDARPPLASPRYFRDWLLKRGVLVDAPPVEARTMGLAGHRTTRRAIVLCATAAPEDVFAAIGRVTVLRRVCDRDGDDRIPTVVLPDAVGGTSRKVCEAAARCGYEFLTAEELVVVLKREAE